MCASFPMMGPPPVPRQHPDILSAMMGVLLFLDSASDIGMLLLHET